MEIYRRWRHPYYMLAFFAGIMGGGIGSSALIGSSAFPFVEDPSARPGEVLFAIFVFISLADGICSDCMKLETALHVHVGLWGVLAVIRRFIM